MTQETEEEVELTPAEELAEIMQMLGNQTVPLSEYQRGFLEGRGLEITRSMDSCPEGWGRACMCHECASC